MKEFACGDVVPGCTAKFHGQSDEDVLGEVAAHAREAHGMNEVSPEVEQAVLEHIHTAPRA